MRLKIISILLGTVLPVFAGCSREGKTSPSKTTAIIGVNNLAAESNPKLLATVGVLTIGNGVCTAFATAPSEITTAAHCLIGAGVTDLSLAIFTSAKGVTAKITSIITVDTKTDYLKLGTATVFPNYLQMASLQPGPVSFAGYNESEKKLFAVESCGITSRNEAAGVFFHACSTLPGMSGGPVLQGGKVVGIHLGYKADLNENVALDASAIGNKVVDLTSLGIKDECGWGCGGDWNIHVDPRNPLDGATIGGVVGTVLGVPVVGVAVGALLGNQNLAQQRIAELKAQNQQQAADLLQAKLDRQNDELNAKKAAENAAASISCLRGRDSANSYIVGALSSAQQTFNTCLQNASDSAGCQTCLNAFNDTTNQQIGFSKQVFGCQ
jgi:hypothetical protein